MDGDNPFLQLQQQFSAAMESSLDHFRDRRDKLYALWFDMFYGTPLMLALVGHGCGDAAPVRPHPCATPEHLALMHERLRQIEQSVDRGGVLEATLRGLLSVLAQRSSVDERYHHLAAQLLEQSAPGRWSQAELRAAIREQALVLMHCGSAAIEAIPRLLRDTSADTIREAAAAIAQMAAIDAGQGDDDAVATALRRVELLFGQAAAAQRPPAPAAPPKAAPRGRKGER